MVNYNLKESSLIGSLDSELRIPAQSGQAFSGDFNLDYSFKNITIGAVVENLFDVDWNETQFL